MPEIFITKTVVEEGHGIASGKSTLSPYPQGTITLQVPIFKELGLDLSHCFPGTLNLSIAPCSYEIKNPFLLFKEVSWYAGRKPETFRICRCAILTAAGRVNGFVYQPDPKTKVRHFDNPSQLQVIAPFIPEVRYGDELCLELRREEIELVCL